MNEDLQKEIAEIIAKKLLTFFNENDLLGILVDDENLTTIRSLFSKEKGYLFKELPTLSFYNVEQEENGTTYKISTIKWQMSTNIYKKTFGVIISPANVTNVLIEGEIKNMIVNVEYNNKGEKQIEIDESNFNLNYKQL